MAVWVFSRKKKRSFLAPWISFCLFFLPFFPLWGQETQYTNSRFSFQLSLPNKNWVFRPPFKLSNLGHMENPKYGAHAFVFVHPRPQVIRSFSHFQKTYISLLDQALRKELKGFTKKDGKALSHPHYLEYIVTYRFLLKKMAYIGKHHFYIYGEPHFGQRILALVWAIPEKYKKDSSLQKDLKTLEAKFHLSLPSRPFPYFQSSSFYLNLTLLIGGLLILGGLFFRVHRRNKKIHKSI